MDEIYKRLDAIAAECKAIHDSITLEGSTIEKGLERTVAMAVAAQLQIVTSLAKGAPMKFLYLTNVMASAVIQATKEGKDGDGK